MYFEIKIIQFHLTTMKKLLLLLSLLLIVISCKMVNKAIINHHTNTFKIDIYTNGDKEVAYLPMVHLGKPEFYDKVKRSVDSLRSLDYAIYYESVSADESMDSLSKVETWKKFRKVTGFFPDFKNKKLYRSFDIKGFVMQSLENTGIDAARDVKADVSVNKLIAMYEKEKGAIVLSDYDLSVPLKEKYKPGKINNEDVYFLVDSLRNDNLASMIRDSKDQKIAVVYGKLHKYALLRKLRQKDSLWRYRPVWETKPTVVKTSN